MGIWNDRKLIVNCLPLTESERAQFTRAAKGMPQEFVGDPAQRGSMNWTAEIPDELKAYATAVIGNITPETCAQCPRLEWLQTWSAGVAKYQRPGVLHPGSMLTNNLGDLPSVHTQWTGSLYDSSFYFNPYMEKYRKAGHMKFPFFLTPNRHYVGTVAYTRTVVVPKAWKGRRVELFLERPHIETTVEVNGLKVGHQMSLNTPHVYDVTPCLAFGRDNRITILRGISLRIPLMMYGAKIDDEDEGITLENFTRIIDADSWAEFMPKGVTKADFNKFRKCYNATVFVAAGKRYRQLAREADRMHVDERVRRISDIFSYFHNPDKETVLTPWRVVNMHMSDTLGGYTFFNERFDGPCEREVPATNGQLFEWVTTDEPRFVDRGEVTRTVFASDSKILEINSKTGLYPLYVAYSLYRQRKKDFEATGGLIDDPDNYSVEEEQVIWDDILANNVYVIRGGERVLMIPAVPQFIEETNVEDGYLKIHMMEGL